MSTEIQNNNNTNTENCQALINTLGTLQSHYEIRDRVMGQIILAGEKIGYKHTWCDRMEQCGTYLETDNVGNILTSNFCRERFCPVCAWKRSLKTWFDVMQIMGVLGDKYDYIFLTLTQKNIPYERLGNELDELRTKWKSFRQSKLMKNARGFIRNIEITINHERCEYHPHQHIIVAFDRGYYNGNQYITHEKFLNQWKKNYNGCVSSVNVQAIQNDNIENAVAEIVKYAVKVNDVATYTDINVLADLMKNLKGKRLINYSGVFKTAKQNLEKPDDTRGEYDKTYYRGYDNKYYAFENEYPRTKKW